VSLRVPLCCCDGMLRRSVSGAPYRATCSQSVYNVSSDTKLKLSLCSPAWGRMGQWRDVFHAHSLISTLDGAARLASGPACSTSGRTASSTLRGESWCVPESIWMLWRRGTYFTPTKNRTAFPWSSSPRPTTVPTELFRPALLKTTADLLWLA
jgi:hypothetical protein